MKTIVLITYAAARLVDAGQKRLDNVEIWEFDPQALLDRRDESAEKALRRAARLGGQDGSRVLVVFALPQESGEKASVVRELIDNLVKTIKDMAKALGREENDPLLLGRTFFLGVYEGDAPPLYATDIASTPASSFWNYLAEFVGSAKPFPAGSENPPGAQGPALIHLGMGKGGKDEPHRKAPAQDPGGKELARGTEDQKAGGEQAPARRTRFSLTGLSRPRPSTPPAPEEGPEAPARPPSPRDRTDAESSRMVVVVPLAQMPTVFIRFPLDVMDNGTPDLGSRKLAELRSRIRGILRRSGVEIPEDMPLIAIGVEAKAPFRIISFQDIPFLSGDALLCIVADDSTELEASRALSKLSTRRSEDVSVIYAGNNSDFLRYVEALDLKCEIVKKERALEKTAEIAANMLLRRMRHAGLPG